jgi:hypothetical protein
MVWRRAQRRIVRTIRALKQESKNISLFIVRNGSLKSEKFAGKTAHETAHETTQETTQETAQETAHITIHEIPYPINLLNIIVMLISYILLYCKIII